VVTDTNEPTTQHSQSPSEVGAWRYAVARKVRRVRRRGLVKVATATVAVVIGTSGYVRPSVRPLQAPSAHAFSF
jgi:hypothetical protein